MTNGHSKQHPEAMNDLGGTPCFNCPEGKYQPGTTTRTLGEEETVLVVKKVSERLEEPAVEVTAARVQSDVRHWRAPSRAKVA